MLARGTKGMSYRTLPFNESGRDASELCRVPETVEERV